MMKQNKKILKEKIPKKRYISPEERQLITDEFKLVPKKYL